ncbi:hypothetical protein B296_00044644 [Ensete ventricosum]|uniref:Uncharacterized protein n=1 Tax=Ensete ventricosum TaxID=4639 RepID=A0A426YN89_ENSVE|nr:hypothetical protein B296_00044644 [Ensete ventricosum]
MPRPVLDRGLSVCFMRRGAISTCRGSTDYNVDLTFNWIGRVHWTISLRPPVWVVHPPLDIMTKVSLPDQVLDLVL